MSYMKLADHSSLAETVRPWLFLAELLGVELALMLSVSESFSLVCRGSLLLFESVPDGGSGKSLSVRRGTCDGTSGKVATEPGYHLQAPRRTFHEHRHGHDHAARARLL